MRTDTARYTYPGLEQKKVKILFVSRKSIFQPEKNYLELVVENSRGTKESRGIVPPDVTPEVLKKAGYQILNPIQAAFFIARKKWFKDVPFSAICASPTSSGKTGIILIYLDHFLRIFPKGIMIYVSPRIALAREKFYEFQKIFGKDRVEIKTGDNPDARVSGKPILVCTPDYLSLSIRNSSSFTKEVRCVIVDEVHTLFNQVDGSKSPIDEVLWFVKEREVPFLFLSATIPLLEEMIEFYTPDLVLKSNWQPVPLEKIVMPSFQEKRKLFCPEADCPFSDETCRAFCPLVSLESYPGKEGKLKPHSNDYLRLVMLRTVMRSIANSEGKKVLIFVHSKENGWKLLELLGTFCKFRILNSPDYLPFDAEESEFTKNLITAFYCADLDPAEKVTIEKEFLKNDNFPVLITTSSLAYGVNLPADVVVIPVIPLSENRWIDLFVPDIIDCVQMAGRAGRYGMSEKGRVYFVVRAKDEKAERIAKYLSDVSTYPYKEVLKMKDTSMILANSILLSVKKKSPLSGIPHFSFLAREAEVTYEDIFRYRGILSSLGFITEDKNTKELKLTTKGEYCLTTGISPFVLEKVLRTLTDIREFRFRKPDEKECLLLLTSFYLSSLQAESTYKSFVEKRKISVPFTVDELPETHFVNRVLSESSFGVYQVINGNDANSGRLIKENSSVFSLFLLLSGVYFLYGLPKPFADLSYVTLATKNYAVRNLLSFLERFKGFSPGFTLYALHAFNHQLRGSALLLFLAMKALYREKLRFGYFKKSLLALSLPFVIPSEIDAVSNVDFLLPAKKVKAIVEILKSGESWKLFKTISESMLDKHAENRKTFFRKKFDPDRVKSELDEFLTRIKGFINDCELSNYEIIQDHRIYTTEICELIARSMGKRFQDKDELKRYVHNYFKIKQAAF